ncbi:MAG TPA: ABC transporter permease, partial [Bryobacteraceae bacterium]|nr:ABC transporter permease [Bryobacteraceae bacterium]
MRWRRLLLRRRRDEELQAEIEHYIEQETADNLARGMNFDEARGAALRKFGNQTVCREAEYEMNSMIAAESFWRNLMYAARQLRKQPGFAVTAILSLGMAMGANTAIFQLLDAVRLRSLPVYKPHELADIRVEGGRRGYGVSNGDSEITLPLWEQIRKHQQAFSNVAGWNRTDWEMGEGSDARNVDGLHVTGAFFDTLGVQPHRGRLLNEADDQKGCAAGPAIISYFLWQRDFGGRDDAIGATLRLDGKPYQVVGVTPPNFFGLDVGRRADAAIPDCTRPGWRKLVDERNFWSMNVIGRLQPGWTLDRASDHLRSASAHWIQEVLPVGYDAQTAGRWSNLRLHADAGSGGRSQLRNAYENSLWLMLGITGLVLVLGCTNLSSLLLARAVARQREMGLRLAIGASRKQLLAQLLTESLLLAFAGALCALVISRTLSRALVQALSMEGQRLHLDLATDWRVVGFITAVGLLTCVLFGLAPALKAASGDAFSAIRTGVRSTADRDRLSLQHVFVTAQIAVAVVL